MKSKLWSATLCPCLAFLIAPSRMEAQTAAPKILERDTGGDAFSIEPLGWWTRNSPSLRLGLKSTTASVDSSGNITYPQAFPGNLDSFGKSKYGAGAVLTFPTGSENSLQVSYFRVQGRGNQTLTQNSILLGNPFASGDALSTSYKVQDFKLSWNYLTFPHPSNGARLRIKTLWEIQYVTVNTVIDAPLDPNTASTGVNKKIFLPTLGLGVEYHAGKHLRLEAKGSGFGLPHRAVIWDTEASAVIHSGRLEVLLGGKAFHYKTSPKDDQYYSENLWGPYLGLRWIWR